MMKGLIALPILLGTGCLGAASGLASDSSAHRAASVNAVASAQALSIEAVFGRHLDDQAAAQALPEFGGAPARVIQRYADGRVVAEVSLPATWQWPQSVTPSMSIEMLVLEGRLQWAEESLARLDYLQWPAGRPAKNLRSEQPSRLLVFIDPPAVYDPVEPRVVRTRPNDWGGSSVSQRDTGVELKLEIRTLFKDDTTGRWTWLLRAGPDLVLPWEVHRTVEEVYLIEGDYQLYECLPEGKTRFDYRPGGYFHRPAGIVHGGPDSGSPGDILMLLRTPTALTVEFRPDCPAL
jgi:hypothetical protein